MPVRLPEAWADVATKQDLRNLEDSLTLRMDSIEARLMPARSRRL